MEERFTGYSEQMEFLISALLDSYPNIDKESYERQLTERANVIGFFEGINTSPVYTVLIICFYDNGKNITDRNHIAHVNRILEKHFKCRCFYSGGKIISFLIGTEASFDEYLHSALEKVLQYAENSLKMKCGISVSHRAECLSDCHELYQETLDAMGYFKKPVVGILSSDSQDCFHIDDAEQIFNIVSEVRDLIRNGAELEIMSYLKQLFDGVRQEAMSMVTLNMALIQIYSEICQNLLTLTDMKKEIHIDETIHPQRMFTFSGNLDETEDKFIRLCLDTRKLISVNRKKSGSMFCEKAMQMIENEYGNSDMSLNYVSSRINVSPNYLSAMLKKNEGKNFVDLLTAKRMEVAKDLILYSSLKIREISEKCGYSDQHYFSHCFKKYTGMSPSEMRQQE